MCEYAIFSVESISLIFWIIMSIFLNQYAIMSDSICYFCINVPPYHILHIFPLIPAFPSFIKFIYVYLLPYFSIEQCNTNIKFLTEYEYEYIPKRKYHRIRISNIFISRQLTEYEYRIYSCVATWPNTNIEYICF